MEKKYELNIDPRILELLGPSLYTNIYYILAELIANAYDADANNVYIIDTGDSIIVEDDGRGMSYENGEIKKYLNVASISRSDEKDASTPKYNRKRMGRKGVGKLAALSVSEDVLVKTMSNGEKSGFILSRNVGDNKELKPLTDEEIIFEKIKNNGTAVVMKNPQYKLHSTLDAIKRNLLKIFPLVNSDFRIHIISSNKEIVIDDFDKEIINELGALIILGDEFSHLKNFFSTEFSDDISELIEIRESYTELLQMVNNYELESEYTLEIKGWIGVYKSSRGRKINTTDFPDNFISLYSNSKMGEFNVIPSIGQNKLNEVYVVGQLHVDLFELSELPDMALSNRQGYKSGDIRYKKVLEYTRKILLPDVLKKRQKFSALMGSKRENKKIDELKKNEVKLKKIVDEFLKNTSKKSVEKVSEEVFLTSNEKEKVEKIINDEINSNIADIGVKNIVDSQKKKILISHTSKDKDLADVVYEMLLYNNVPAEDVIYTNCDTKDSWIPEGVEVYEYLRDFFVESYSDKKIFTIFITSEDFEVSWGALMEAGAAWITKMDHQIFNIRGCTPKAPLDDRLEWHTSSRSESEELYLDSKFSANKFISKICYICDLLGYSKKTEIENAKHLETLILLTYN